MNAVDIKAEFDGVASKLSFQQHLGNTFNRRTGAVLEESSPLPSQRQLAKSINAGPDVTAKIPITTKRLEMVPYLL